MFTLVLFLMLAAIFAAAFRAQLRTRIVKTLRSFGCNRAIPFSVRQYATWGALRLAPVAGSVGQNGAIVLLKVNITDSAGDEFDFIGGQGNLTVNDTTAEIDVSDKLSGRLGERVPGRATASVAVDLNFLRSDVRIAFLKTKYRNRQNVEVMVFDRTNLDIVASEDDIVGTDIESAVGIITNLTETHPDQDKSTISLEISLNNDWVAAA